MNGEARRERILSLLRSANAPRSGSDLARELGVSAR